MTSREEDALAQAFALRTGTSAQREEFVRIVDRLLGRRLQRYFERHRVPEAVAEEMVWDVYLKLIDGDFRGETRPEIWLWSIARNHLISYHRKDRPEVSLDEDSWEALIAGMPGANLPAWVSLCIERAVAQFELDHPERAQVLRMIAEEWSAKEIGEVFSCSEGAARDRAYRTREMVREYLVECREEA